MFLSFVKFFMFTSLHIKSTVILCICICYAQIHSFLPFLKNFLWLIYTTETIWAPLKSYFSSPTPQTFLINHFLISVLYLTTFMSESFLYQHPSLFLISLLIFVILSPVGEHWVLVWIISFQTFCFTQGIIKRISKQKNEWDLVAG